MPAAHLPFVSVLQAITVVHLAPRNERLLPAGAQDLYVHSMAVNLAAKAFYESCGFVLEQEETSNHAHYRYGSAEPAKNLSAPPCWGL